MNALLDAALTYARDGLYVVPADGKRPRTPHGHLDATTDPEQIRKWWATWPDANIGIAPRRSGHVVVDIDPRNGGDKTLADLEAKLGPLPRTFHQRSGGGGEHFVMLDPGVKLRGKLPGGIDIKDHIIVAPSGHASGGHYEWLSRGEAQPMPVAWVQALRRPPTDGGMGVKAWAKSVGEFTDSSAKELRAALRELGPGGQGENTTYRAVLLVHHDFGRSTVKGRKFLTAWNATRATPHSDEVLDRQVARVAAKEAGKPGRGDRVRGASIKVDFSKDWPPLASEVAASHRPPVRIYSTGLAQLDALFGGGTPTRGATMLVAPTGVGKTGLTLSQLLHLATEHKVPSVYGSTELERHECIDRLAALILDVPHRDIMQGRVPRSRVTDAVAGLPIHVLGREDGLRGSGANGVKTLRDAVARVADKHGIAPGLGVDYLQMMVDEDPKHVRMGVTSLAYAFHDMAQDLDILALVVSSTGRAFYRKDSPDRDRDDPMSYLGSAKESGDVEYACTNLVFLDVGEPLEGVSAARLVVAKARFGERQGS